MKVGIVGFSGSGKSGVFQWLTGVKPDPSKSQTGQTGIAQNPRSAPRLVVGEVSAAQNDAGHD